MSDARSAPGDDVPAGFEPAGSDAGAAEEREVARHVRPTRIGRVDLTVTWRRTVRVAEIRGTSGRDDDAGGGGSGREDAHARYGIASPLDPVTKERGVLWVLLTWSR